MFTTEHFIVKDRSQYVFLSIRRHYDPGPMELPRLHLGDVETVAKTLAKTCGGHATTTELRPDVIGTEPNLYEAGFNAMKTTGYGSETWRNNRASWVRDFAWAIPNRKAIEALVALSPIVEIGAGSGYWARLITASGGDIVCYDSWDRLPTADWFPASAGGPIRMGGPSAVTRHQDRALLLIWPKLWQDHIKYDRESYLDDLLARGEVEAAARYREWIMVCREADRLRALHPHYRGWRGNMEYRSIKKYCGNTIAIVGENWGCTGCDRAKTLLGDRGFRLDRVVNIPRWHGIHDALQIYKR